MDQIEILTIGKAKEPWLEAALAEYEKRLPCKISITLVKDNAQLFAQAQKRRHCLALDPRGKLCTSEEFSDLIRKGLDERGRRLTLIIGGADGLPSEIRNQFPLISLSPLTFTHQITRLILFEQIYRATEIWRGSKYHRA